MAFLVTLTFCKLPCYWAMGGVGCRASEESQDQRCGQIQATDPDPLQAAPAEGGGPWPGLVSPHSASPPTTAEAVLILLLWYFFNQLYELYDMHGNIHSHKGLPVVIPY